MSHNHPSTAEAHSQPAQPRRKAAMAAVALSLGMGALSLAAAPAAQAAQSGTAGPCTVTAERPYANGHLTVSGKKIVVYPIRVRCTVAGIKVRMEQKLMEADPGSDTTQKNWFTPEGTPLSFTRAGTQTVNTEYRLTATDWWGGPADVYHQVKFRAESNGVASSWVTVESAEREIYAH